MNPEDIKEGRSYYTKDGSHMTARLVTEIFEKDGKKRVKYNYDMHPSASYEMSLAEFADMIDGEYL